MEFEPLFPPGAPASATALLAAAPVRGVGVNMVASVDGRIAVDGRAVGLGSHGDHALFNALRRSVDAVLVGTRTIRVEGYGPLPGGAACLMVTRSGDVPWEAPLFDAPEQRVGIAGPVDAVPAHVRARVTTVPETEPAAALAALRAALGVEDVLCEGGPLLNRALLDAGVFDELFLTVAPSLRGGDAPTLLAGGPANVALRLRWVLRAGDELFLRYSR